MNKFNINNFKIKPRDEKKKEIVKGIVKAFQQMDLDFH